MSSSQMFFGLYMHVLHTQYINIQSAGGRDKTEKPERKFTQNIRKRSVQCRADGENEVYEQTLTVPAEKKYLYPNILQMLVQIPFTDLVLFL